jgi:hypothetical protein
VTGEGPAGGRDAGPGDGFTRPRVRLGHARERSAGSLCCPPRGAVRHCAGVGADRRLARVTNAGGDARRSSFFCPAAAGACLRWFLRSSLTHPQVRSLRARLIAAIWSSLLRVRAREVGTAGGRARPLLGRSGPSHRPLVGRGPSATPAACRIAPPDHLPQGRDRMANFHSRQVGPQSNAAGAARTRDGRRTAAGIDRSWRPDRIGDSAPTARGTASRRT